MMTGNRAALPMWTDFMISATRDMEPKTFNTGGSGMVSKLICVETGMLATPYCPETVTENYVAGQEPSQTCNLHTSPQSSREGQSLKNLDKESLQPR